MLRILKWSFLLSSISMIAAFTQVHAACTKTTVPQTEDSRTAKIIFGKVNLPSTHLLPAGSVIDTKVIPPTAYTYGGANAESLLWTCDKTDLDQIYFLAATNGDDRVGGYWDLGAADGLKDVYATYFANIGLQQSMAGVPLTRIWQKIPITNYDEVNGKIEIRLKHLPALEATLYRISSLPPSTGASSAYCGTGKLPTTGSYSCNQPSAYIQLSGTNQVSIPFAHDQAGEDGAQHYRFWGADNGFGYGLNTTANTLTTTPACAVRNNTPLVTFPTVSAQEYNNAGQSSAQLQVQIECENLVKSGTATGQTAITFQANSHAYTIASELGLVAANGGGAEYLVSDQYGQDEQLASGIGIQLFNPANGKNMLFSSPDVTLGGGEKQGWYPVLEGQPEQLGATIADHSMYMQNYQAILKALPGQKVTPGKVKATATIVVKVQ